MYCIGNPTKFEARFLRIPYCHIFGKSHLFLVLSCNWLLHNKNKKVIVYSALGWQKEISNQKWEIILTSIAFDSILKFPCYCHIAVKCHYIKSIPCNLNFTLLYLWWSQKANTSVTLLRKGTKKTEITPSWREILDENWNTELHHTPFFQIFLVECEYVNFEMIHWANLKGRQF